MTAFGWLWLASGAHHLRHTSARSPPPPSPVAPTTASAEIPGTVLLGVTHVAGTPRATNASGGGLWAGYDLDDRRSTLMAAWKSQRAMAMNRSLDASPAGADYGAWERVVEKAGAPNAEVVIAVLGGSMTAGQECLDPSLKRPFTCAWPSRLERWLRARYPESSRIRVINFGAGSTSSEGAAMSLHSTLGSLNVTVDMVLLDLGVNDYNYICRSRTALHDGTEDRERGAAALETLVRALLCERATLPEAPAVVLVQTGTDLPTYHEVAERYALPSVSFQAATRPFGTPYNSSTWQQRNDAATIGDAAWRNGAGVKPCCGGHGGTPRKGGWSSNVWVVGPLNPACKQSCQCHKGGAGGRHTSEAAKLEYYNRHSSQLNTCLSRVHPPFLVHEMVMQVVGNGAWAKVEARIAARKAAKSGTGDEPKPTDSATKYLKKITYTVHVIYLLVQNKQKIKKYYSEYYKNKKGYTLSTY